MKKKKLVDWQVYSKIEDKNIQKNIKESEIWKESFHYDELSEGFNGFEYVIAFDGVTPVQVKKVKKIII